MNRRGFLSMLGGTAAAMTLDPEKLHWRPGAKLISIPKRLAMGRSAIERQLIVDNIWMGDAALMHMARIQRQLLAVHLAKRGYITHGDLVHELGISA